MKADTALGRAQELCERGAHQDFRDGEHEHTVETGTTVVHKNAVEIRQQQVEEAEVFATKPRQEQGASNADRD